MVCLIAFFCSLACSSCYLMTAYYSLAHLSVIYHLYLAYYEISCPRNFVLPHVDFFRRFSPQLSSVVYHSNCNSTSRVRSHDLNCGRVAHPIGIACAFAIATPCPEMCSQHNTQRFHLLARHRHLHFMLHIHLSHQTTHTRQHRHERNREIQHQELTCPYPNAFLP